MSNSYYRHSLWIPEDVRLSFDDVFSSLNENRSLAGASVKRLDSKQIELQENDWRYHLHWADEPFVQEEAEEFAEIFARGRDDSHVIASATVRIEGHGDGEFHRSLHGAGHDGRPEFVTTDRWRFQDASASAA